MHSQYDAANITFYNDLEPPKYVVLVFFLQFVATAHADFKSELPRNGWR